MRWRAKKQKVVLKAGMHRYLEAFLWYPRCIAGEWRWWEWGAWEEVVVRVRRRHPQLGPYNALEWRDTRWTN